MHMSAHRYALAYVSLENGAKMLHFESAAMMSWLRQHGREGVEVQLEIAHSVAAKGAMCGCPHSQGALANCVLNGWHVAKNPAAALKMAKESASKGSQFGQYVVAMASIALQGHNTEETAAVVMRNLKLASDQGLPEARLSYATALLTFFKDIENESEKIEKISMQLYEQAAFCGSLGAQTLIRQIRVIDSKAVAAKDLETLASLVKKNVSVTSRMKILNSAYNKQGGATSMPSQSKQAASGIKSAGDGAQTNPSLDHGSEVPDVHSPSACAARDVKQEERKGVHVADELAEHPPCEPSTAFPSVMARLGKMLGTQYCPDCDKNATIGTKCAVSGSYHML